MFIDVWQEFHMAGVCPLNMSTSEELSAKQELMLVSALEDVVCMVSHNKCC